MFLLEFVAEITENYPDVRMDPVLCILCGWESVLVVL